VRTPSFFSATLVLAALAWCIPLQSATGRELRPQSDDDIIEALAPRPLRPPAGKLALTVEEAVTQARLALESARQLQDPRYLGRARAIMQPWWGKPQASEDALVLQATIEQSLHQFSNARKTLARVQEKNPSNVQATLTLASLDRLVGNYARAMASCEQVKQTAQDPTITQYGQICALDIQCHTANSPIKFRQLLATLTRQRAQPQILSWAHSLLAECEERTGNSAQALDAYRNSLAVQADSYTALAYADALIRKGAPDRVQALLAGYPRSDAVLLRQAHALRLQGNPQWKALQSELHQRFAESSARGDDPSSHARERAYAALWLDDNYPKALEHASINIDLQKEAIDWQLLFQSLDATADKTGIRRYALALQETQIVDKRLARWTKQ
jgi:hypothetical protein